MNKKIINIFIIVVFLLSISAYARESVGMASGNLTTADACGFGMGYTGVFFGYGDAASCIGVNITYGFSDYTEGRIKLGFSDLDGSDTSPEFMGGFDLKYKFMDYYDKMKNYPLDLAFGGFVEYVNYKNTTVLEIGGGLIGSIPYRFKSGRSLIPYTRANIRLERFSVDCCPGDSESNYRFGLNLGVKYELSSDFNLYGEVQIDGNLGVFTGLEFLTF